MSGVPPPSRARSSSRRDDGPATVASSIAAGVRVFAECKTCTWRRALDLDALAAGGHAATALLALPLTCGRCRRRGHRVTVMGVHPHELPAAV